MPGAPGGARTALLRGSPPDPHPPPYRPWDAEGRLISFDNGATLSIVYNALGERVMDIQPEGSTTRLLGYPLNLSGRWTGVYDDRPSMNWIGWDEYQAYVAGQRLEMGGSTSYLAHVDAVGSMVMETDQTGAVTYDIRYYPWGQLWLTSGSRPSQLFAGLEWQLNDPTIPSATREYNDGLGRWMTPDPGGRKVVKLDNPQTWNMYAYVTDNPTTLNDPGGLAANVCTNRKAAVCTELPQSKPAEALAEQQNGAQGKIKGAKAAEAGVLATAGCLAAEPCGAAATIATVAVGAVTTGYFLYKNKDAIKQGMSQIEVAAKHIGKLNGPSQDPRNRGGWRREVQAAIKRARVWQNRMSPGLWKDAMGALIDQAQSALPEE